MFVVVECASSINAIAVAGVFLYPQVDCVVLVVPLLNQLFAQVLHLAPERLSLKSAQRFLGKAV